MPPIERADDHLGELRDALAQMSFALMAVLRSLSLIQLRVLDILRDCEPTLADLANFTGLEGSTISSLVDRAAQRGPAITAAVGDRITPLTGRLSTGEQRQLTALLAKALGPANS